MAAITKDDVERFVRTGVPTGKPHVSLRDGTGLCLRLLPTGKASWQFVYRVSGLGRIGTPRTVTIGPWPAVDVEKARREAAWIRLAPKPRMLPRPVAYQCEHE